MHAVFLTEFHPANIIADERGNRVAKCVAA
jgi:hypothetical protein